MWRYREGEGYRYGGMGAGRGSEGLLQREFKQCLNSDTDHAVYSREIHRPDRQFPRSGFHLLLELLRTAVLPAPAEAQDGRTHRHPSGGGQRRGGKFSVQGKGEDGVQAVSSGLKRKDIMEQDIIEQFTQLSTPGTMHWHCMRYNNMHSGIGVFL